MNTQIYMIGVGGQGIGLLAEVLAFACDAAGLDLRAVDTHGLAQRGGSVESFLRVGKVHSPLIAPHEADLVIALERTEALRGLLSYAKPGGQLYYYDTSWQPLSVRLGSENTCTDESIQKQADRLGVHIHRIFIPDLPDTRMQNVAVLARLAADEVIPSVKKEHFLEALQSLLPPKVSQGNLDLFERIYNQ